MGRAGGGVGTVGATPKRAVEPPAGTLAAAAAQARTLANSFLLMVPSPSSSQSRKRSITRTAALESFDVSYPYSCSPLTGLSIRSVATPLPSHSLQVRVARQ